MSDNHRWSGWPGAICIDCGLPDQREVCLADSCENLWIPCPCQFGKECAPSSCSGVGLQVGNCTDHVNPPCPHVRAIKKHK